MYEKLSYKGFVSTPKYSIDDMVIYGHLENADGFISYEAEDPKSVEPAFIEAVEGYLDTCRELGVSGGAEKHSTQYCRSIQSPGLGSIRRELALNVKKSKHDVVDGNGNCSKLLRLRLESLSISSSRKMLGPGREMASGKLIEPWLSGGMNIKRRWASSEAAFAKCGHSFGLSLAAILMLYGCRACDRLTHRACAD